MSRMFARRNRWLAMAALSGLVWTCGCELPPNFWADKSAEILNLSIIAAINAALSILTGGFIQI